MFAGGFFFGGGGLSGLALVSWNLDAAQPDDEERKQKVTGARADSAAMCSGLVRRWVWWDPGWWLPHWQVAEAEVRGSLLLLRRSLQHGSGSASISFGQGRSCKALPLVGAKIDSLDERSRDDPPDLNAAANSLPSTTGPLARSSEHIRVTTAAGEQEELLLPSPDAHSRWTRALQSGASPDAGSRLWRRVVDVAFPSSWQGNLEEPQLVPLEKHSDEYRRVARMAKEQQHKPGAGGTPYVKGKLVVKAIERVQMPHIWEQCERVLIRPDEHQ